MKITEAEQIELRNRAKDEMERLEQILSDKETVELLDRYKNRFNLCESVYKVVLREHQNKTKGKVPTYLKINMTYGDGVDIWLRGQGDLIEVVDGEKRNVSGDNNN